MFLKCRRLWFKQYVYGGCLNATGQNSVLKGEGVQLIASKFCERIPCMKRDDSIIATKISDVADFKYRNEWLGQIDIQKCLILSGQFIGGNLV